MPGVIFGMLADLWRIHQHAVPWSNAGQTSPEDTAADSSDATLSTSSLQLAWWFLSIACPVPVLVLLVMGMTLLGTLVMRRVTGPLGGRTWMSGRPGSSASESVVDAVC